MKTVKRWRYYCDFCKKAGQSGFHMKKHELTCTLNPARACRMCDKIADGGQADMAEMLALLPDPAQYMKTITPKTEGFITDKPFDMLDDEKIAPVIVAALPALRELVSGCPVCIMAAFRQKKIPLPLVEGFNFTKEMNSFWADINAERNPYDHY